jgi:hypothetical protein
MTFLATTHASSPTVTLLQGTPCYPHNLGVTRVSEGPSDFHTLLLSSMKLSFQRCMYGWTEEMEVEMCMNTQLVS